MAAAAVSSLAPLMAVIDGLEQECLCVGPYRPSLGDQAVASLDQGVWRLHGWVSSLALPSTAVVTATSVAGKPYFVAVTDPLGQAWEVQCPASLVVAVDDEVGLEWGASTGRVTYMVAAAPPAVVPPTQAPSTQKSGSLTFSAIDSGSWRGGWRGDINGRVIQGDYGGYGQNYGAWFYGGQAHQKIPAGAVATRATILLSRPNAGGTNAPVSIHLYHHTSDTRPASDVNRDAGPVDVSSPPRGGRSYVNLPLPIAQGLIDSGGGVGIRVASTSPGTNADYAILAGLGEDAESGQITIDWQLDDGGLIYA
jgi:hypothetical protein